VRTAGAGSRPRIAGNNLLDSSLHHGDESFGAARGISQGDIEAWRDFDGRDRVSLLSEVANPEDGDRVVGYALHQADGGTGTAAVAHGDTDQNQFNACEDSESQSDTEDLLAPAIFEKATKNHQQTEKSALHDADALVEGKHHGYDPISTALLTGERRHDGEEKKESAGPAKNDRAQILGASILFKYVLQDFIHHGNGEDDANGVAGPVCVEVALQIIVIGEEEDGRFENLEDDVGKEARENAMQLAMDHAGEQGDL